MSAKRSKISAKISGMRPSTHVPSKSQSTTESKSSEEEQVDVFRDTRLGAEGSLSFSLSALKIFGDMGHEEISGLLDAGIDEAYNECKELFAPAIIEKYLMGLDKDWNEGVVALAMAKTPYRLEECTVVNGCCAELLCVDCSFLVDGNLNPSFIDFQTGDELFQHGHHVPQNDPSWKHTIAVRDGLLFCPGADDSGISSRNLRLSANGFPDSSCGYFSSVTQVYRIIRADRKSICSRCCCASSPSSSFSM
jgi:hypothetical protein